ncbi:hypothetical protein SAMN05192558_11697 [Actinokineospora alba]|uniref:Uncharacterized protein n=1 Tax=Actinokineospora alba TaxID=504798 RepID=A0A1H0W0B9_9PSEU|nr:hypothetical protein [Actinokineospora alba]TDP67059.1 hypothetical protein C8E96_2578 [Actinokineospora alba]SDJ47767.1 hypothetical protein SAMN05421871_11698 [Actinokineospora alba]SDP83816.1 hypothetical protein SAMN05192558_11697 [Actinokineospora alba]
MTGPTDRFPHSDPRTARLPTAAPQPAAVGAATVPLPAAAHDGSSRPSRRGPNRAGPGGGFGGAEGFQPDTAPGDYPTEPFDRPDTADDEPKPPGFWRELSGALTLGLCVLALVVVGLQVLASAKGMPGPGFPVVLGHAVAAIAAVVFQRQADRRQGSVAALPVLLVAAITAVTIWFFWWS